MDESTVAVMLRDLAETPPPPSSVDISRAAVAGRRRVRMRRLMSGASAAGVAAVVALVAMVSTGLPTEGPGPNNPGSMPSAAPAQFDPFLQYAEFGWLPEGSVGSTITIDPRFYFNLSAEFETPAISSDQSAVRRVDLWLAPAGQNVEFGLPDVPAPGSYESTQFNGREAWWFEDGSRTTLRWQYAPQTWAAVDVVLDGPGAGRDVARRVAENVRYGVDLPIRQPFTTTGVPTHWWVCLVMVYRHGQEWDVEVTYAHDLDGDWALTIHAAWPSERVTAVPTTVVDGYPARTDARATYGAGLQLFNVDGMFVDLQYYDAQTGTLLPDGLVGVFRATEFYPDPADWR